MFSPDQYELLDFGEGRKLERFGPYVLDRPAPGTETAARTLPPGEWRAAAARLERVDAERGRWQTRFPLPSTWCITHGRLTFEVKPTESGNLGVFPEQAENWDWLERQILGARERPRVLNLFAHTGGSTLAAAAAGADVTHVDAAQNVVAWARQNAGLSGLADAPIRWIAEDAEKYVRREIRRGSRYHGLILDPPSYGHGPRGEVWKLGDHLESLMELVAELTAEDRQFVLLTCHTTGLSAAKLKRLFADALGDAQRGAVTAQTLALATRGGDLLHSGLALRWFAQPARQPQPAP